MAPEVPALPVFSFVGPSGAGKTSLLEKLLPVWRQEGWRVGAIKHSHHPPKEEALGTDSFRLRAAGASRVHLAAGEPWWEAVAQLTAQEELDWMVLEGYHGAPLLQYLVLARGDDFPEERKRAQGWILGAFLRNETPGASLSIPLPVYRPGDEETLARTVVTMAALQVSPFPVAGAILAGGGSRRMGKDKRLLRREGRTWLAIAADALGGVVEGPLFAAGFPPQGGPDLPLVWLPDLLPGEGPLAALYGLALRLPAPWLLVVASDMPFLTEEALLPFLEARPEAEAQGADALLPFL
ncbi:MAG: molybdopterin-guanine dinucleotide biosynthesis protein MobB [Bacillota bacterium]|nr:molybdopterin-guanine dinucleotide biosynthesis protein MobB [Bacillota bacterium]